MAHAGLSIAIQGELVGWNIEGNPYNYPENKRDFFVYTVIDIETRERWHPKDVKSFADDLGLKHVKIIGYTTLPAIAKSHKDLLDRADKGESEGLVFKCCDDNRWFKVLSSKYIITKGDEARAAAEEKARSGKKNNGAPPAPYGQHLMSAANHSKQPVAETATTKTTPQANTNALVTVTRSLEENQLSFEEAAGLVPKPNLNKMSLAFLLAPTSPTQESQVDKMSSVPFIDSAHTKEEAAAVENSQVRPLTPKPLIILFTNADISSHKQETIPIQSSDNSPHSTTHTEAQPITAAADTNTETVAREPGYYKMNKADFDHFTKTCFAAENAGAHGWLDGWSSDYLQTHGKPLEFDSTGNIVTASTPSQMPTATENIVNASAPSQVPTPTENIVNASAPAQVPTPIERQTRAPAPAIPSRWTNSRLRYNSLPIVPVVAAPKDILPTVRENTRWLNTTLDLTDEAPTVHKESVALTTRDNNGELVKMKLTIKSGTLPARFSGRVANTSTRANSIVPHVQTETPRVSPAVAHPTSIVARPASIATRPALIAPRIQTETPRLSLGAAPPTSIVVRPATSSQRVPLVTLRVLGATSRVSSGVARPASIVARPATSSQGLTFVPAGPTSIPRGVSTSTVTVAGAAGAASAASAATANPRHLPISGGEQTMSGRYRGFAQWLGIVGGGGVDDVCQE